MRRGFGRFAAVLLVGLGGAGAFDAKTSATGPAQPAAPAVADWSLIAQNTIVASRFPGEAAVYMGIVHAAIYDVVVAIEGGYRPYAITPTVPPSVSVDAAVAAAAYFVLVARFPGQQVALDLLYSEYLKGIPDGEAKANGILVGGEVAAGMVSLRTNDGLDDMVPYVQPPPARESMNRPRPCRRSE